MKTCCFCLGLKGGATASAIFTLVIYAITSLGCLIVFILQNRALNTQPLPPSIHTMLILANVGMGVCMAIFAFSTLCSALLLNGIWKGTRGLFFPWISMMGFYVGCCLITACLLIPILGVSLRLILVVVSSLLGGAFYCYMIWCVSAYCIELSALRAVTQQGDPEGYRRFELREELPRQMEKDTERIVA